MLNWGMILAALAGGFFLGQLYGRAMEAWDWRMSADSHHQNHKSAGRWFDVRPKSGYERGR
jgi:hypothetical protein